MKKKYPLSFDIFAYDFRDRAVYVFLHHHGFICAYGRVLCYECSVKKECHYYLKRFNEYPL